MNWGRVQSKFKGGSAHPDHSLATCLSQCSSSDRIYIICCTLRRNNTIAADYKISDASELFTYKLQRTSFETTSTQIDIDIIIRGIKWWRNSIFTITIMQVSDNFQHVLWRMYTRAVIIWWCRCKSMEFQKNRVIRLLICSASAMNTFETFPPPHRLTAGGDTDPRLFFGFTFFRNYYRL